jgi:AmmeMemoRadiSam system protein B
MMHTSRDIRISDIMGTWYPADPVTLRRSIDSFFERVPAQPLSGELRALIAPHAGYQFSGPTAAYSYKQIVGKTYDAVVVAGPSHRAWLGAYAISSERGYVTPFGTVPLAQDLIAQLEGILPVVRVHESEEHSIELQLPFLQVAVGPFQLVPILMNAGDLESCVRLGQALAALTRGRNILLVASTDLNHLSSYAAVCRRDAEVISALESFDLQAMARVLLADGYTVCGRAPLLAISSAAQAQGAARVRVLHHTNSGDVTGRKTEGIYTVGYLSAALTT